VPTGSSRRGFASVLLFIRQQARPVSHDEAGDHVGISRKLAAFHLDKPRGGLGPTPVESCVKLRAKEWNPMKEQSSWLGDTTF
jgi:hypothetical protein